MQKITHGLLVLVLAHATVAHATSVQDKLFAAIKSGSAPDLFAAVNLKADVNQPDSNGLSPLMAGMLEYINPVNANNKKNYRTMVGALLNSGANPNQEWGKKQMLFWPIFWKDLAMVKEFVEQAKKLVLNGKIATEYSTIYLYDFAQIPKYGTPEIAQYLQTKGARSSGKVNPTELAKLKAELPKEQNIIQKQLNKLNSWFKNLFGNTSK